MAPGDCQHPVGSNGAKPASVSAYTWIIPARHLGMAWIARCGAFGRVTLARSTAPELMSGYRARANQELAIY